MYMARAGDEWNQFWVRVRLMLVGSFLTLSS